MNEYDEFSGAKIEVSNFDLMGKKAEERVNTESETFIQERLNDMILKKATGRSGVMQQNFRWFGIATLIYACMFTFCLYRNASGITVPLFAVATLVYYRLCMNKLDVPVKKSGFFYEAAIILLAFATCITDDSRIILMNYMGIFILTVSFMLHHFFNDEKWDLPQYISNFAIAVFESPLYFTQPFSDCNYMIKSNQKYKNSKIQYVITGLLISIPLIIVILMLLQSADIVFAKTLESMWKNIIIPENIIGIILMTIVAFFAAYCFMTFLAKEKQKGENVIRKQGEPVIAITFNSLIAVIYIIFCAIQVIYLFMGKMQIPDGYTYAQYAREGFFQLVAVCLLNLGLVLFCIYYYRDHKLLKMILTVISLCTYIMIASSGFRMILYIREYKLTFLRVFVLWALILIFLMMTGIVIYIIKSEFNLLKYTMITVTVLYIIFSFSHPDYFIAKYNYGNDNVTSQGSVVAYTDKYTDRDANEYLDEYRGIDTDYMSELCADAAPVILDYAKRVNAKEGKVISESLNQELYNYFDRIYGSHKNMNIRTFNYSGYAGKKAAVEYIENY